MTPVIQVLSHLVSVLDALPASDLDRVNWLLADDGLTFQWQSNGTLLFTLPPWTDGHGTYTEQVALPTDGRWQLIKSLVLPQSLGGTVVSETHFVDT